VSLLILTALKEPFHIHHLTEQQYTRLEQS